MLFGMFKEKEIIDNTNFDTTKGDIVEDFGGMINNQNNDKDLIPLSSFSGSHGEDINYQNIDLNNPQTIINSINENNPNNNMQQPIQTQTNSQPFNYQTQPMGAKYNVPVYNQQIYNQAYSQQIPNINPNMVQPTYQPMQQSIQQNGQMYSQPINVPTVPNNIPNGMIQPNQNFATQNSNPPVVQNIPVVENNNASIPNNIQQSITPNTENNDNNAKQTVEAIDNTKTVEVSNAPVEILTELPNKKGMSSLTSTLLDAPTYTPNVQNTPTIEVANPTLQSTTSNVNILPNSTDQNIQNQNTNTTETKIENIPNEQNPQQIQELDISIPADQMVSTDTNTLLDNNELNNQINVANNNNIKIENINAEQDIQQSHDIQNYNIVESNIPNEQLESTIINTLPNDTQIINTNDNEQKVEDNNIVEQNLNIPITEVSNDGNEFIINMPNSIDDEIKKSPIPSILPTFLQPVPEQPKIEIAPNINESQTQNIETQLSNVQNPIEEEHKFVISDNIDVEPGFKICPKCGQKIRDDYKLCFVCGTYF